MRLIDADALDKKSYPTKSEDWEEANWVVDLADIRSAPTISPAANWTPCSVALPKNTGSFKVTVQVGSEAGSWRETMIIPYRILDGVGEWFPPKSEWKSYSVIAWADADEPYRGEA